MQFNETYQYPAPIDEVWKMLSDPAYSTTRAQKLQLTSPQTESTTVNEEIQTVTTGGIDPEMLPAAAKKFIGPSTRVTIKEQWDRVGPGRITGSMSVEVKGVPAGLSATASLSADGDKTEATLQGDVTVRIPLLGKRLEREAIQLAPRLAKGEQEAAAEYLGSR